MDSIYYDIRLEKVQANQDFLFDGLHIQAYQKKSRNFALTF